LPLVERLALGDALHDVDHHHGPGEVLLGQPLGRRGPDITGSNYGNFSEHAPPLSCEQVKSRCRFT
jgi:hypothetical protein